VREESIDKNNQLAETYGIAPSMKQIRFVKGGVYAAIAATDCSKKE